MLVCLCAMQSSRTNLAITPKVLGGANLGIFPGNCTKLKKIGPEEGGGGGVASASLDPPIVIVGEH